MKKIVLFSTFVLSLSLISCDDYKEANPPAQYNPQGNVLKLDDISVTGLINAETPYDLITLKENNLNIVIAKIEIKDFPSGYELGSVAYISGNDFQTQYPLASSVVETETEGTYEVYVTPDDLQATYYSYISKGPGEREVGVRFMLTAYQDSEIALIGGPENYYSYNMIIQPMPAGDVIESAYYLVGDVNNWGKDVEGNLSSDIISPYKFDNGGKDPYSNPVFNLYLTVGENCYWQIVPQSGLDDIENLWTGQVFGTMVNGDDSLTGILTYQNPQAGMIAEAGRYLFTINMLEQTYTITPVEDWMYYGIYVRGGENSWGYPAIDGFLTTNTEGTLIDPSIYLPANTEFKIADSSWNPINLGLSQEGVITFNNPTDLVNNGANLKVGSEFVGYAVLVNADNAWKLTMKPYVASVAGKGTGIYLRGGMNDWGATEDWEFMTTAFEGVYELENATIASGTEFKVADANWSFYNMGSGKEPMALNVAYPLDSSSNSSNIVLEEDFAGTIVLIYNSEYKQYFLYYLTEEAVVTPN